jgi:hypothetical protein
MSCSACGAKCAFRVSHSDRNRRARTRRACRVNFADDDAMTGNADQRGRVPATGPCVLWMARRRVGPARNAADDTPRLGNRTTHHHSAMHHQPMRLLEFDHHRVGVAAHLTLESAQVVVSIECGQSHQPHRIAARRTRRLERNARRFRNRIWMRHGTPLFHRRERYWSLSHRHAWLNAAASDG